MNQEENIEKGFKLLDSIYLIDLAFDVKKDDDKERLVGRLLGL